MIITEKQVEERFNKINTLKQSLDFIYWVEDNSFNMSYDLYDVAIKAGNQLHKDLKENWLSSREIKEQASKSTLTP